MVAPYGSPITGGFNAQSWPVNVPAGLAGHTQIIAIFNGFGSNAPTIPQGWQQWGNEAHSSDDHEVSLFIRVLTEDKGQEVHTFGWPVAIPGSYVATVIAGGLLQATIVPHETGFSSTYTHPNTPVPQSNSLVLYALGRKDAKQLLSWPGTTLIADVYNPGGNQASGSVGYKIGGPSAVVADTLTILDPYNNGLYNTAPWVGLSIVFAPTVSTTFTASGAGVFSSAPGVGSVSIAAIAPFAIAAQPTVTITVLDSAGDPMSGQTVALAIPNLVTANAGTAVTNGSGVATFTLTGVFAGTGQITASAGGVSGVTSVVVTGQSVAIVASAQTVNVGNQVTFTVTTSNGEGGTLANQPVSFNATGAEFTPITANTITGPGGALTYVITADAPGLITISAIVAGTASLAVMVTVNDETVMDIDDLRLRGIEYIRINPVKR